MNYNKLADLLLPDIDKTPEDYINMYPKRNLDSDAIVTRYAPSPTGFQHIGGVFASLVEERSAHLSNGVFYLRIEDTDKKREVVGAIKDTVDTLKNFGIEFDEGMINESEEKGIYGPYKQSSRMEIYQTFVKSLIQNGLAYPCFCSEDDLNEIREKQQNLKLTPGYYGKWAVYRNTNFETIEKLVSEGKPYVIRLKSPGNDQNRVVIEDAIKGKVSMPENIQDIVILKSDRLPTYHFAHAVDDSLMGTTHVIRGEEWLASFPIHVQLFEVLGFTAPKYAHIPTIMKIEGNSKRKLSKRKDPEVAVEYYTQQGYPFTSVIEYLLNIINSDFEDWRAEFPLKPYTEFPVRLDKISKSGALFDINKLSDVSKNVISRLRYSQVYNLYLDWARKYDEEMAELLIKYEDYCKRIFNIDREGSKPRKDYGKWMDVREKIYYFFDELFYSSLPIKYNIPDNIDITEANNIINEYTKVYMYSDDKDTWFSKVRDLSLNLGYAKNGREYKKNKDQYKGTVADVASVIRVALTNNTNTPDLYEIMQIMDVNRVKERFELFLK